jgi:hypothetical protein
MMADELKACPLEPTIEMLVAGRKQTFADMTGEHMGPSAENTWKAMWNAAPDTRPLTGGVTAEMVAELSGQIASLYEISVPKFIAREILEAVLAMSNASRGVK